MKASNKVLVVLASSLALLGSMSVSAGVSAADDAKEKGVNTDSETRVPATPEVVAVQNLALAGQLEDYGDKNKDPMALIMAAKIIKSTPTQPTDAKKEGSEIPKDAKKDTGKKHDVASILNRAKSLATGRQDFLAMITDVEAMTAKGAVGGPKVGSGYAVDARSSDSFNIRFRGNEEAIVYVEGDGDTDLDLYIYDQNGNRVCKDDDYTDRLICSWYPRWTGNFTIKIVNRGSVYNQYGIMTN